MSNTFESLSTKAKEIADGINNRQTILANNGLQGEFGGVIADVVPTVIKEANKPDKIISDLVQRTFDPSVTGDKERAQLELSILKNNAEVASRLSGLTLLQSQATQIAGAGGLKASPIYQSVTGEQSATVDPTGKLKRLFDELADLLSGVTNPQEVRSRLDALIAANKASEISVPEQARLRANQRQIASANMLGNALEADIYSYKADQTNLANGYNRTALSTQNQIDDARVEQYRRERARIELEYRKLELSGATTESLAVGRSRRDADLRSLDSDFARLPLYGGRFVQKIEDAVAQAAGISAALRSAIEKGDWSNVLNQVLSNIAFSLADSFAQDAQRGLGDIVGGGLKSFLGLGGIPSKAKGDLSGLPSFNMGTLGCLPSYANGLGIKSGASYLDTPYQDPREPYKSKLAVINERELVVPANLAQDFVTHAAARTTINSMGGATYSNSRSSADTYNTNITNNYKAPVGDTFGRNTSLASRDQQRRENGRFR